jgi:hypothetical protein
MEVAPMADESYVTNEAWLRQVGRPDLVDDVADQFERAETPGLESFWSARESRANRGWRSFERLHPRTLERRAG